MSRMNGFVAKKEAIDLETAILKAIEGSENPEVKSYFQAILNLPKEDQQKWFFTGNELKKFEEPIRLKTGWKEYCVVIQTICALVAVSIMIWDSILKEWVEKIVEKEECRQEEIQVPCPQQPLPEKTCRLCGALITPGKQHYCE